jgi:hypothetical protein
MDCRSVTFYLQQQQTWGCRWCGCMFLFSNNLGGSDLYIIYCLINSRVQPVLLALHLPPWRHFLCRSFAWWIVHLRAFWLVLFIVWVRTRHQRTSVTLEVWPSSSQSVQINKRRASGVLLLQNMRSEPLRFILQQLVTLLAYLVQITAFQTYDRLVEFLHRGLSW